MPPSCRSPRPWPLARPRRWERGIEMKSVLSLRYPLPGGTVRHWLQSTTLALAVLAFMGAGDDSARFKDLGHRMMCTCGCGQILLECNHVGCQSSTKMRDELLAAIDKGNNDDLILQGFVQNYGPTVIAAPTASGFNSIAWIMPFAVL